MHEVLVNIFLAVLGLVVISLPYWLPRWSRWLDTRRVRRDHERRGAFPAVEFDGDLKDKPTIPRAYEPRVRGRA